jgi:hypothetical protein
MPDNSVLARGPRDDESIPSIVLRLAPLFMVNVVDFVRYALNVFGKLQIVPTRIEALWRLAELTGWDPMELEKRKIEPTHAGFTIYRREIPAEWIDLGARRVAPAVLAADETPYHRFSWQAGPLECDLSSGEVLIDHCPRCDANLGWDKIEAVFTCQACGFDVREQKPTYAPADRLLLARELHGYLTRTADPLPEPLDALDELSQAHAMEWLAFFSDLPIGRCLKPSWNNAASGLAEVRRWPQAFDHVMSRFLASASFAPGRVSKGQMIAQLTEAIDRAGTPALRHLLLDRAIRMISSSPLSDIVVSNRIFGRERDVRTSAIPRDYSPSLREVLRMDSMRVIQSATSARPRGS